MIIEGLRPTGRYNPIQNPKTTRVHKPNKSSIYRSCFYQSQNPKNLLKEEPQNPTSIEKAEEKIPENGQNKEKRNSNPSTGRVSVLSKTQSSYQDKGKAHQVDNGIKHNKEILEKLKIANKRNMLKIKQRL